MKLLVRPLQSIFLVGCFAALTSAGFSLSKGKGNLSLEELVALSDEVVVGHVKDKKVNVVGHHFETDYDIEVSETLKGKSANKRMTMTVMGGTLTTPPLTQYVQGQAFMHKGEHVALFVKTTPAKISEDQKKRFKAAKGSDKSKLLNTPRVVGMTQGKFSVITDKATGREKVAKFDLEEYGFAPNDIALEKSLQALETGRLKKQDGQVVQPGEVACKSPACLSPAHGHPAGNSKNAQINATAQQATQAAQGQPIVVQDLQDFKDQVRKLVK